MTLRNFDANLTVTLGDIHTTLNEHIEWFRSGERIAGYTVEEVAQCLEYVLKEFDWVAKQ